MRWKVLICYLYFVCFKLATIGDSAHKIPPNEYIFVFDVYLILF